MAEHDELIAVVRAMVERIPIDWANAESSAVDEPLRATIRELKIVAEIAALHHLTTDSPSTTSTPSDASVTPTSIASQPGLTPGSAASTGTWGPLTLVERVAEGSFGEVYRALDTRLDREVALKLLRQSDARSDRLGSTVIEEARLLARVRHPNVVTIYGADRIDGRVGLWMEFVHGQTLEQAIRQHETLNSDEVAALGIEICRALAAVHEAGLLHRDVKAHNVMRQDDGRLVLMDFGAGLELTEDGGAVELAGTPLYLAPEVLDGQPATVQSDLYSVGVLLYHLLTGAYPVNGRTVREIRENHHLGRRVALWHARTDVARPLLNVVNRALASDLKDRYRRADDMAAALAACLETSVAPPASKHALTSGRPLLAGAIALASIGAVVVLNKELGNSLPGRPGRPNGTGSASVATVRDLSSLAVRQVLIPGEYSDLGMPSVDGRYFAFLDRRAEVAVKNLETGEVRQLTRGSESNGFADGSPRMSADNRLIVYPWVTRDRAYELRVMDLRDDGAEPQARTVLHRADAEVHPIQWSRDATEILSLLALKSGETQIALVSVADGIVRAIKRPSLIRPLGISLSPDSRFVIYDRPQDDNPGSRDIYVVATDGSGEWPLVEHPASDMFPSWMPDGHRVLFTSDRTGALGLWMIRIVEGRAIGEPEVLSRDMGRMTPLGPTNAGGFFFRLETGLVDVYTVSLDSVSGTVVGKPQPVLPNRVGSNISSDWSADGRHLAYVKIKNPAGPAQGDPFSRALSIRDISTAQERDLWPALAFFIAPRWAPDGRSVLVNGVDLKQRTGLHRVDVSSGRVTPALLDDDRIKIGWPRWMTGDVIAFQNLGSDGPSIVSYDLSSGAERKLAAVKDLGVDRLTPVMQGTPFSLSPDGRWLAFSGWVGSGEKAFALVKVMALGGAPTEIVRGSDGPGPKALFFQTWTPDGLELLFTKDEEGKRSSLWRVNAQGGTPRPVGLEIGGLRDVHVSADGGRLTFTAGSQIGDVRVMENFLPR
jgi:serine/threonine protein kinase/Tol biopolymer transport system component